MECEIAIGIRYIRGMGKVSGIMDVFATNFRQLRHYEVIALGIKEI